MGSCCLYVANNLQDKSPVAALGLVVVSTACFAGTLRFGVNPARFTKYNESLARLAGAVGFPLLGLAFMRKLPQLALALGGLSDLQIAVFLMIAHTVVQQTPQSVELLETVLNGAGMAAAAYYGTLRTLFVLSQLHQ